MADYPSVHQQPEKLPTLWIVYLLRARYFWYPVDQDPADLVIGPTTLIIKSDRARLAHDWTKAGLNQFLETPATRFDTMDDFLNTVRPHAYMAGLDIRDVFYHWALHPDARRRLGVRRPIAQRKASIFHNSGPLFGTRRQCVLLGKMVLAAKRGLHQQYALCG